MKSILRVLVLFALSSACLPSQTQVVRLRSGQVLVGTVRVAESGQLFIDVRYPEETERELSQADVLPESLVQLLDRAIPVDDVPARMRLADIAAENDMFAFALAELRGLRDAGSEHTAAITRRLADLQARIPFEFLSKARESLDSGRPRSALMYLHSLQERFPDSAATKGARELMKEAHAAAGSAADVDLNTVSHSEAAGVADNVSRLLQRGTVIAGSTSGHVGRSSSSSEQRRRLERAVRTYERAWQEAKSLPVSVPDAELANRIASLRVRTKSALARAYLSAGSLFLQRLALPRAEQYCDAACELDPDNKDAHALHNQIINAKISRGF